MSDCCTGSQMVNEIRYDSWRIYGADRLNRNEGHVFKFGSETELRDGTIEFDTVSVKEVDSYPLALGYAEIKLFKQIEVKPLSDGLPFANKGDSGALVFLVERNNRHAYIGIVEGGTSYGTVIVTPIVPILQEIDVPCLKNFETESNLSSIHDKITNLEGNVQSVRGEVQNIATQIQVVQSMSGDLQTIKQLLQNISHIPKTVPRSENDQ